MVAWKDSTDSKNETVFAVHEKLRFNGPRRSTECCTVLKFNK